MAGANKAGQFSGRGRLIGLLMQGVSAISLGVLTATGPAFAQAADQAAATDEAASEDEIVVTGIRSSLRSSQEIKRNADVFVDSITAEDIGALPDRSVTEALQRVPGVAINRFAASVDPDHFSVEGSGVVVRGLNFVRSEFNGRDTFTANNGRALSFADVTPELLSGVDVFKSPSADMIEGGISGTVNLRTRLPFDSAGSLVSGSFEANYGDLVEAWAPSISVLLSNRWELGDGSEVGFLVNFVDSELKSRSDGTQVSGYGCRPDLNADCATGVSLFFPRGAAFRSQTYDRGRVGNAVAAQWESADDTMLATFQFLRSESRQSWTEHAVEIATDNVNGNCHINFEGVTFNGNDDGDTDSVPEGARNCDARPVAGTTFGFDDSGVFTDGVITGPTGWRDDGNYNWRDGRCVADFTNGGCQPRTPVWGLQSNNIRRDVEQQYVTSDVGFNFKWTPNDHWKFNFDFQHVESTVDNLDTTIWGSTFQNLDLQVRGDEPPIFTFLPPDQAGGSGAGFGPDDSGGTPRNVAIPPGTDYTCLPGGGLGSTIPVGNIVAPAGPATNGRGCTTYFSTPNFSDPSNSFWRSAMDHIEQSEGTEDAARIDVDYDFGDAAGWLDSVRVGARWSERDQTARFSTYNWGVLSETWGQGGPVWFDDPVDGVQNLVQNQIGGVPGSGFFCGSTGTARGYNNCGGTPTSTQTELFPFANFFRGEVPVPTGSQALPFYAGNTAQNYAEYVAFATMIEQEWRAGAPGGGSNGWRPLAARPGVVPGTPFLPGEINPVTEETTAYYAMLRFGEEFDGGAAISGNIGVRYFKMDRVAEGFIAMPQASNVPNESTCFPPPPPPGTPPPAPTAFCTLSVAERNAARAFANGALVPNSSESSFEYWLPSLNVKWNLNEELLLRFGASQAVSFPELGLTRNFFNLTLGTNQQAIDTGGGRPSGTTTVGNPFLKPILATNYDASIEWYFADVGSLTFALFYKELEDVITNGTARVPITNSGVTYDFILTTPINSDEEGTVQGFEIAYQQTYDFLPGPLSGLGLSANYTYIDSSGVSQSTLSATDPDVAAGRVAIIDTSLLPLQGLSEHNFNIAGFYEKGPIQARLAYSWRSEFVLTVRDVITPFAPIVNEATGQLDGSLFIDLSDNWKIGVQGVNLTNEVTQTSQVLNNDLLQAGRSWFMNDRRYTLILRATF